MKKSEIQNSVLELAKTFCARYPQNNLGKINYSIGGSVSAILLSMADKCEKLDTSKLPLIVKEQDIEIDDSLIEILKGYQRKVGDIDIGKKINKKYVENMKDIKVCQLSDQAKAGLQNQAEGLIACNHLTEIFDSEIWKIAIDNREFYIQSLENMFKNKLLYIVANYDRKYEHFNSDLSILQEAVESFYGPDKMNQIMYDIAKAYNKLKSDKIFRKSFIVIDNPITGKRNIIYDSCGIPCRFLESDSYGISLSAEEHDWYGISLRTDEHDWHRIPYDSVEDDSYGIIYNCRRELEHSILEIRINEVLSSPNLPDNLHKILSEIKYKMNTYRFTEDNCFRMPTWVCNLLSNIKIRVVPKKEQPQKEHQDSSGMVIGF